MGEKFSVSVIIPTLNAQGYIEGLLCWLEKQTLRPREIIVIDSESDDMTETIAKACGLVRFETIRRSEFSHGRARNMGVEMAGGDVLLFMTQDAIPLDDKYIENLVEPLGNESVAASYGRQIPKEDANPVEKFSRGFNYPPFSMKKGMADVQKLGVKTFFFTNVCSAIRKKDMAEAGGFDENVIMNEDMLMAATLMKRGKYVFYAADARVHHSHNYRLKQQFSRNFDIGVFFRDNSEVFKGIRAESEGLKFLKEGTKAVYGESGAGWAARMIVESGFKYAGYIMGKKYRMLPNFLRKRFSMHSFYWDERERA